MHFEAFLALLATGNFDGIPERDARTFHSSAICEGRGPAHRGRSGRERDSYCRRPPPLSSISLRRPAESPRNFGVAAWGNGECRGGSEELRAFPYAQQADFSAHHRTGPGASALSLVQRDLPAG